MTNLLYIYPEISSEKGGAEIINERNLNLLKSVESINVYSYILHRKSQLTTFWELIKGNTGYLRSDDLACIARKIEEDRIDIVFLWSSRIGKLAGFIKKKFPDIKVITFFHNIEHQYFAEQLRNEDSLKNRLVSYVTNNNESVACSFSDYLITLNSRDSCLLEEIYGKKANLLLPTSFKDSYNKLEHERIRKRHPRDPLRLLFVGSNFFANTEGVRWFLDHVMPSLHGCTLTIVGKGMDNVFGDSDNVKVKGYVDSLYEVYYSSDLVISPIFSGGGMKTKTCEAMMYGIPIIGTDEAFEGYDCDWEKGGGRISNHEEMIREIEKYRNRRDLLSEASEYLREVFLRQYETSRQINSLQSLLQNAY